MSVSLSIPDDDDTSSPALIQATTSHVTSHACIFDVMNDLCQSAALENLVQADPSSLGAVNVENGRTPLHTVASRGDSRLIRFFVENGAKVEVRDHMGETPFLLACQNGSLYAVHTMVECGADTKVVDNQGRSAMHHAALIGAVHIMHYLRETQDFNFKDVDNDGNTPLHLAIYKHKVDTMKYLLRKKRVDRTVANKKGETPLHLAVKHSSGEMVWLLMSNTNAHRKMIMAKNENGCTPVKLAEFGPKAKRKVLAKKMEMWSFSSANMRHLPWINWSYFACLPGLALLLAPLCHSCFSQPLGFILALILAVVGFFLPITRHRIYHDAGWQNPSMLGGLFFGVIATTLCYFIMILPRLWPTNFVVFIILTINSFIAFCLFIKLKITNPGHDRVGKISKDGHPLTIVDVAKQGMVSADKKNSEADTRGSPDYYAFCTYCEIVIPERTKHCKLCNACCNGFDHHCMWLTTCIGYNNHRFFVLFTIALALDNILFLYESFKLLILVTGSVNVFTLLGEGFSSEHWIFILIICNTVAAIFSLSNLYAQLSHIAKLETTFFDVSGRPAYNLSREKNSFSLITKLRLIHLFFTDYKKWYNRPTVSPGTTCYPKYTV